MPPVVCGSFLQFGGNRLNSNVVVLALEHAAACALELKEGEAYRRLAMALYGVGLIVLLAAVARETLTLGTGVLVLAGTVGGIRLSRKGVSNRGAGAGVLRRTLCRLGAQIIVAVLVLIDIGGLAVAVDSPVLLAPWTIINLAVLVFGALSWSEEIRVHREGTTAARRRAEQLDAERRNEERLREMEREEQAERLRHAELRDAELRRRREEEEREARKQEQAEQLRQAKLREAELRRRQEEAELETQRQEVAELLRQAEQLRKEAESRRRTAEREAQRARREAHTMTCRRFHMDWWTVLGLAPSASKDDIVRTYRHKIKECHPDRVVGLAPEFLELAEERTKTLNEAYANAMRSRAA